MTNIDSSKAQDLTYGSNNVTENCGTLLVYVMVQCAMSSFMTVLYNQPFTHPANRHALKGNACILLTAGLMYPQNVTTPITIHRMFTI